MEMMQTNTRNQEDTMNNSASQLNITANTTFSPARKRYNIVVWAGGRAIHRLARTTNMVLSERDILDVLDNRNLLPDNWVALVPGDKNNASPVAPYLNVD
jgi:hypothetical protein